ncbi:hypothetical protein SteCoe_28366 [Stentor coeruleus]|uniref:Uncharacterized protein n=1 Tax=Stentor coeruleus TaxID=5963 RepID=A0A1R2B8D7_9CILI|nr:hypothetical protein SteCoe_28366 [Stentor coeruleus]
MQSSLSTSRLSLPKKSSPHKVGFSIYNIEQELPIPNPLTRVNKVITNNIEDKGLNFSRIIHRSSNTERLSDVIKNPRCLKAIPKRLINSRKHRTSPFSIDKSSEHKDKNKISIIREKSKNSLSYKHLKDFSNMMNNCLSQANAPGRKGVQGVMLVTVHKYDKTYFKRKLVKCDLSEGIGTTSEKFFNCKALKNNN